MLLLVFGGGVLLALLCVLLAFMALLPLPFFARGAPFVSSDKKRIRRMVEFAGIKPGERAVDLGAGDGRLVIALARAGAVATGFEINPLLVLLARLRIAIAGLSGRARVERKNFWRTSFAPFDVVTVYGLPSIMQDLEAKLRRELKPGSRVVSNAFPFPHWQPTRTEKNVYVYAQGGQLLI